MRISMRYGRNGLQVELPDNIDITVIEKKSMPVILNTAEAVLRALSQGVGCGSLAEEAKGSITACVAICDITRPVPNGILLRPVIEALQAGGIGLDNITLLIATGLHRPNEGAEMVELVNDPWVLEHVRVENHHAREEWEHLNLGMTKRGTPVKLDHRFVEADIRIVIGLVEPHLMAGYSGGRKLIVPGVAHHETIRRVHSPVFIEDPMVDNCNLLGNPLHEEQMEIAGMVGRVLAVNVVIDEARRISLVNFGDIADSHAQAVKYLSPYCRTALDRRYSTVLTSSAGYPLDATYYQTVKSMVAARGALTPGGDLFVVSECSEGIGSPDYVASQKILVEKGADAFLLQARSREFALIDEWETVMQAKAMRAGSIHLFAGELSPADIALTGVLPVHSLQEELLESVARSGDCAIAVIPDGPYTIPYVSG